MCSNEPSRPVVLMLQGPPSGFWRDVASALEADGARVVKVHVCFADVAFWRRPGAYRFKGRLGAFRRWLLALMAREGVTDILYYADRLPYHRIAQKAARAKGVTAWALEFGYLRPDWLTLEPFGNSAWSHFPNDPAAFAEELPEPDMTVRHSHSFAAEAFGEVAFNLLAEFGRPMFPRYAPDKYYWPIFDYLAWLPKLARGKARARAADALEREYVESDRPFILAALQMQSDFALRHSAPWPSQKAMIGDIVASFARTAPAGMRLLFKTHPLDNGLTNWTSVVAEAARASGVEARVACIDGGDFGRLAGACAGLVCATSTTGLHALRAGKPVKALGAAVYDVAGLTHQGPLDRFWREGQPPDPDLLRRFLRRMAAEIQVKGSIYQAEGRRRAATEIARRIRVGLAEDALPAPPRLAGLLERRRVLRRREATPATPIRDL